MDTHSKVIKQMNGRICGSSFCLMKKAIKNILLRELLIREYSIATPKDEVIHNALNYRYRTDWVVCTNAILDNEQLELWEFEFCLSVIDDDKKMKHMAMKLRQKFLMVLGLYYTGVMKPKKMSFVVTDAGGCLVCLYHLWMELHSTICSLLF